MARCGSHWLSNVAHLCGPKGRNGCSAIHSFPIPSRCCCRKVCRLLFFVGEGANANNANKRQSSFRAGAVDESERAVGWQNACACSYSYAGGHCGSLTVVHWFTKETKRDSVSPPGGISGPFSGRTQAYLHWRTRAHIGRIAPATKKSYVVHDVVRAPFLPFLPIAFQMRVLLTHTP